MCRISTTFDQDHKPDHSNTNTGLKNISPRKLTHGCMLPSTTISIDIITELLKELGDNRSENYHGGG